MRTEGEFGAGGRRLSPYKGPLGAAAREGHEVAQLVERLDGGGVGEAPLLPVVHSVPRCHPAALLALPAGRQHGEGGAAGVEDGARGSCERVGCLLVV
jgi:hypothetical protein